MVLTGTNVNKRRRNKKVIVPTNLAEYERTLGTNTAEEKAEKRLTM